MKRPAQHHFRVSLTSSVRARLTLWYLAMVAFITCLFGGSLYVSQTFLNADAAESRLETKLYQDSQRFAQTYGQALLNRQALTALQLSQSSQEMVLLLRADGSVLDARGPLTGSEIQQLRARAGQNSGMIDLTISQNHSHGWWAWDSTYRVLMTPVLNQNVRVAILLVGLQRQYPIPLLVIWLFHGTLALLVAAIGGYWLAGKALRPVKMITRTANEIGATDLRRRLNLQRRDEFGELAATFDHMLARLEAAFKRQAQFTADASHELRTPLTIVDLDINRALTQLEQPEEYRQVLEQIQAENEQMTTNLIENGIKYTSGTGKRVYVELACEQKQWGVVRVQDDGPGISEEHLPYLFERFYRVDKARSRRQKAPTQSGKAGREEPGGSGLGLSIVQWIVQAHGGEIRVESNIGAGTLFEVRLPLLNMVEE